MAPSRLRRTLATLAAVAAVTITLPDAPAGAIPPGGGGGGGTPSCWVETTMYQQGEWVYATAFKDCVNAPTATPLSLEIQVFICDPGHCFWPPLGWGTGSAKAHCSPGPMRNSRQPDTIFHCT